MDDLKLDYDMVEEHFVKAASPKDALRELFNDRWAERDILNEDFNEIAVGIAKDLSLIHISAPLPDPSASAAFLTCCPAENQAIHGKHDDHQKACRQTLNTAYYQTVKYVTEYFLIVISDTDHYQNQFFSYYPSFLAITLTILP